MKPLFMPETADESAVYILYQALIKAWNERSAKHMAELMTENGNMVGFDGTQLDGQAAVRQSLQQIFADHSTAAYVTKVREIRMLAANVGLLRAVVGMVPPGQSDINPSRNAIQSLLAVRTGDGWKIALFHNTPAAFDGRPEAVEALTNELREQL